jgi:osmotically-inducible protein OsmY
MALLVAALLSACAAFAPDNRSDARINAQVQALLAENGGLKAPNQIDVQTRHGVVYLHGLVDTPFQQALAASLARQVPGVSRVENLIAVSDSR